MRAVCMNSYGGPEVLKLQQIEERKPGRSQVLVQIKMAGINYIDIYQRRGTFPAKLPYVPGLEAAGIVEEVGEGVHLVKPGDHVAYVHKPGSYAEKNIVLEDYLIPLPKGMSFELGAAFPLQGITAHYLLHEFRKVKKDDTLLIHAAAGGMGLLLVQWAKHLGARVIGTVSTEEKAEMAKRAGADEVILYTKKNFVSEVLTLTNQRGVDFIIDGVGKTTFPGNLEAAALYGHIIIFGAASGLADPISPNVFMNRSLTVSSGIIFNYIMNRQKLIMRAREVIKGMQEGWLKLHIDTIFPLEEASLAHQKLESRNSMGKILLKI